LAYSPLDPSTAGFGTSPSSKVGDRQQARQDDGPGRGLAKIGSVPGEHRRQSLQIVQSAVSGG